MSKMRTPAMEKIEKKNAKRKKPVKSTPARESWKRFKRNPTALLGLVVVCILILVAIFAPVIAPYDYKAQDYGAMMQAPSSTHLFGTDQFGRDIFSRVIYGTRYSLVIALFCTIAALFSGGLLGIIAGYFGGTVDTGSLHRNERGKIMQRAGISVTCHRRNGNRKYDDKHGTCLYFTGFKTAGSYRTRCGAGQCGIEKKDGSHCRGTALVYKIQKKSAPSVTANRRTGHCRSCRCFFWRSGLPDTGGC